MSTSRSDQGSHTGNLDFWALPDHCFTLIISLTSPRDACRLSLVSTFFNSVAGSDDVWIKFLPDDYPNLVPALPPVSSLKELYLSLCDNHVLIEDGKKSISLDKESGKKCYMLATRDLTIAWVDTPVYWRWISRDDSRFPEVAELLEVCWFEIRGRISVRMLSPVTHYKAYLVFKMTTGTNGFKDVPIEAAVGFDGTEEFKRTVYVNVRSKDEIENGESEDEVVDVGSEDEIENGESEDEIENGESEDDVGSEDEIENGESEDDVGSEDEIEIEHGESEDDVEDDVGSEDEIENGESEDDVEDDVGSEDEIENGESEDDVGSEDVGSENDVENGDQFPKERRDGWFEVVLGEFFNEGGEDCELNVRVTQLGGHWKRGIIIEGIEIKPHY